MAIQGAFLPTTQVWDTSELFQIDVNSQQFKELLVRMYQNLNRMSINISAKETGGYILDEILTSNQYFQNPLVKTESTGPTTIVSSASKPLLRSSFRTTVNFGALPNTGTKTVAHGISINSATTFVDTTIEATSSTLLRGIKIPYASAILAKNIEAYVDATNVTIITAADWSMYDRCIVVIEYLKN